MHITARIRNTAAAHDVEVATAGNTRKLQVGAKASGRGSEVNGGEFLMLALATCYCNDLFREAARLGIAVTAVDVEVQAEFPGIGLAATDIRYRAAVESDAATDIDRLLRETDAVAEVHNTLRAGHAGRPATQLKDAASRAALRARAPPCRAVARPVRDIRRTGATNEQAGAGFARRTICPMLPQIHFKQHQ